jgi:hypothetical protein
MMIRFKLSKWGRIALKVLIFSLLAAALSAVTANLLMVLDFSGEIAEMIYGVCYVLIFPSIYLVLISVIVLIYQLIIHRNKPDKV